MSSIEVISVHLDAVAKTAQLGEDLALALGIGDCLTLSGDPGAGKSLLADALIGAMANGDGAEPMASSSAHVRFYESRIPIAYYDLHDLSSPDGLRKPGFEDALLRGICLVSSPERAEAGLPGNCIALELTHDGDGRRATISAPPEKAARIRRVLAIRDFLEGNRRFNARRRFLTGDASLRAYEAIYDGNGHREILMDWPKRLEGPPVLDGKPYPKVAHIAEDAYPFVALSQELRSRGFAAPEVFSVDYDQGLLLIEDLGQDGVLDRDGRPIAERYLASAECLAHLHGTAFRHDIPVTDTHIHHVPDFDRTAMKMEARLLLDWHLPWKQGREAAAEERDSYLGIWDRLIDALAGSEKHLLLRDFHSPNIIWRGQETGIGRVGLIDFQDAMIGPTAYDLASIVQDARVTIDRAMADDLMAGYLSIRHRQGGFDEAGFRKSWAIMAAQRNCKLAGLWVRLMRRDGKPGYMKHMPRTLAYLAAAMEHEALSPLREWCAKAGIAGSES